MEIGYGNEEIKRLMELKNKDNSGFLVIEGLSILEELLKKDIKIDTLFYSNENLSLEAVSVLERCKALSDRCFIISLKTFERIGEKENSVPIIAIVQYKPLSLLDIDVNKHKFILINDGIELPGNLGTIYRSAFGCNVDLIINVDLKTSIYKSKFLSSSRGMIFNIPTINCTFNELKDTLLNNNYDILLCEPENGISYRDYEYRNNIAIVVGNERFGINKEWYNYKHNKIYIPMKEGINSLNVGVSASIIIYEASIKRKNI